MATLRRGFSKNLQGRCYRYIQPFCDLGNPWERTIALFVAAAFAQHPNHSTRPRSFGASLRGNIVEQRFNRIVACRDTTELCALLPNTISQIRTSGTPINFMALFMELRRWNKDPNQVAAEWARDYYRREN